MARVVAACKASDKLAAHRPPIVHRARARFSRCLARTPPLGCAAPHGFQAERECARPNARQTPCAPSASSAACRATPKAPASCASATPMCCARRASASPCRHGSRAAARAGSRRNTACCPAPPRERTRREAAAGKQSGRTQEIQRLIGRSLRAVTDLTALGETADHARLRRAPGRRRHAHRGHHRRLGRAARRGRLDEGAQHDEERRGAARPCRRRVLRALWRRGDPRPRLCRGFGSARPTRIS